MAAADAFFETPHGVFQASFSARGLRQLQFPRAVEFTPAGAAWPHIPELKSWIGRTEEALKRALEGMAPKRLPPFDFPRGTPFQRQVWEMLLAIPLGQTMTYGEIASRLKRPDAARAVGQACGANFIPVLIPCHRVRAARGALGGFSGGLDWKLFLLEREGVLLRDEVRIGSASK